MVGMDRRCGKCNNSCRDSEVQCGGYCQKIFHMKCVGLSKYECDAIFKCSNMKFICDGCLDFITLTNENYKQLCNIVKETEEKISKEISKTSQMVEVRVDEAKREIVNEITKKTEKIESETYASKLKTPSNSAPVILKPKNKQECDVTEKAIKEKIKPSSLNLKVDGISKRSDGAVAIKCQTDIARNVLSKEIKDTMGNDYEVQIPKMRKPKILITGLNEELEKDVIIEAIKKQNNIQCGHLECVKVYKSFKNPRIYNALIETDGEGFKQIMREGKINVEWDRCPVYESCHVLRCFKCWGFNHTAKTCKNESQICAKCSESGHTYKDCKNNTIKCVNCEKAKERLNLSDVDSNHDCRSTDCRILQRKNKIEANRVEY